MRKRFLVDISILVGLIPITSGQAANEWIEFRIMTFDPIAIGCGVK